MKYHDSWKSLVGHYSWKLPSVIKSLNKPPITSLKLQNHLQLKVKDSRPASFDNLSLPPDPLHKSLVSIPPYLE